MLDTIIETSDSKEVSGKKAFELYDTFGFPIDLTSLILREKGFVLNEDDFHIEMKKQKERSRSASESSTDDWTSISNIPEIGFDGYDATESEVKITRFRKVTSKKEGDQYQLVFNQTPFYPEGGGQVGDKGYLEDIHGDVLYILNTKKENNVVIHFTKNLPKNLEEPFNAVVDEKQRHRTSANHSATHLLHQALREVLGTHVEQKGSAVNSKHLRFDFSHFSKLTSEELHDVEYFVNARIEGKLPLEEKRSIPKEEAIADGAISLFGEKYGDKVRSIRFGQSIELCGGTHVPNTSEIWHFKIKSEGAVAAGIRRIEAITMDATKEYYLENNSSYQEIKDVLNNPKEPVKAILALQQENSALKKQLDQLIKAKAKHLKSDLKNELKEINEVQFLAKKIDLDANSIKTLAFELGSEFKNLFLLFGAETNGKAILTCYVSKEIVASKNLNAGTIVRELGKYIQGGGGGQAFFATAGGKNPFRNSGSFRKSNNVFGLTLIRQLLKIKIINTKGNSS